MCEALSLARLGWLPALCLRAGPSLARQHQWQSPAGRGSDSSGGGGRLAGQKQYFGGPGSRALRGCHHHHDLRVSTQCVPPPPSGLAPPRPAFLRSWPLVIGRCHVTRSRFRRPLVRPALLGAGPGCPAWRPLFPAECAGAFPGIGSWCTALSGSLGPGGLGELEARVEGSRARRSFLNKRISRPHRLTYFHP